MRISVVIPTFQRRAMVREAVLSVLRQEGSIPEIIVVDDGSSDDTAQALASEFGAAVRIVSTAPRGVAAARNLGVAAAAGDWVAFLDSDDLWRPDKLARQTRFLRARPDVDICYTDESWERAGRRVNQRRVHRKPSGRIYRASLRLCLVGASTVLMRRSLFESVGGFDEGLAACEDYDLWLRIARDRPIWLVDEPLVIKRAGHGDQLSARFWGMDRFRVASLSRLLAEGGLGAEEQCETATVLEEKCAILAGGARRRGRPEEAERYERLGDWATSVGAPA